MAPDRSREAAFLAAAAGAFLDGRPLALPAEGLDWERALQRAEAERLLPLLYAAVRSLPLPDGVLGRLRAGWLGGRRQHLLGVEQLGRVLSVFEREGVVALALKGPALGEMLYRDPGLRPFTDLDLLVRPADAPRAISLLSALGYRHLDAGHSLPYELAWRHAAPFVGPEDRPDRLPIDLHWGLLDAPGIAPAPPIDHREIWERAVKVNAWEPPARGLCPEDLLIYLAVHWALHHAFSGLIWGLDLALLLRRFGGGLDWEGVAERARRWRVRGALYFALREVEEQFPVGVPASALARLRPHGLRRSVLEWLRHRRDEQLERLDYLIPVLLMDRRSDLLRALASGAFPPAGWARFRYGTESLPGAYLAHYARIGKVCLRTLRAALPR
ncbi:MAG: nucleotidyltransferase family protein [Candidatus Rokubacteria bacterium]|nr:nucleotidyltransferase family protein [Candidatus Rokubacteria bacterium]